MISAFRSELFLLNRFRVWLISGLVTIAFTATATTVLVMTSSPAPPTGSSRPGSGTGIPLELLNGPGGATAAVSWSIYGFGFLLLLTAFTSRIGNDFSNGTFRTALLQHPNRWSLIGGKMSALMLVATTHFIVGLATGAVTATILAPSQGLDTTSWFSVEAIADTAAEFVRMTGWAFGWALIATTLAVVVRSVPLALGIGVFWFGPIENVIGDELAFAERWFPGLLLQEVVSTSPSAAVSTGTAVMTLAAYGLLAATGVAVLFKRLDVTS